MTEKTLTLAEAGEEFQLEFGARISLALKDLLETKHLYQSVSLSSEDLVTSISSRVATYTQAARTQFMNDLLRGEWVIRSTPIIAVTIPGKILSQSPDVKLFCEKCNRLQPFSSVATHDLVTRVWNNSEFVQVFALSLLCQACKAIPEVFTVRRQGSKLTLCGRAPIEHVEVPLSVPKSVHSFYKGGILAFQSGQTLAGNFMLRTVIEQFTRIATRLETATQADRVMDAYMDSLPNDFKARFPSMRDLYGALSSDIHRAEGSSELFEKAQAQIVEHFDALRLFKIGLPPAQSPERQEGQID